MSLFFDVLVKSTLVLAVGLVAMPALGRSSAAVRHFALLSTAAALAFLPLLDLVLPRWQVPLWRLELVDAPISAPSLAVSMPAEAPAGIPWMLLLWGTVGLAVLGWSAFGWISIALASRLAARRADGILEDRILALGMRSRAEILVSDIAVSPMTWGCLRPRILLPSTAASWSDERLRAALLHEIAHIRRWDWLTQSFTRLVCAAYALHPGVWLLAARLNRESERAADDEVLLSGCSPEEYATHLLEAARSVRSRRFAGAVAMARSSALGERILAIVSGRGRKGVSRTQMAGFAGVGILAVLPLSAAGPTVLHLPSATDGPQVTMAMFPTQSGPARERATSQASSATSLGATSRSIEGEVSARRRARLARSEAALAAGARRDMSVHRPEPAREETAMDQAHKAFVEGRAVQDLAVNEQKLAMREAEAEMRAQEDVAKGSEDKAAEEKDRREEEKADSMAAAVERKVEAEMRREKIDVASQTIDTPEISIHVPAIHVHSSQVRLDMPAIDCRVPGVHVHIPKIHIDVPKG